MLKSEPQLPVGVNVDEIVDRVCDSNSPMTITSDNGNVAKIIPVPKPIKYLKNGRPVYRLEDAKYLVYDCPWLLD